MIEPLGISCMGVSLVRLTSEDIELVRQWRNHPEIKKRMSFRNTITQEKQVEWFNSVNNNLNYYFLIEYKKKKIGLINAKNLNLTTNLGEGGIFIWDMEYWNSPIPVLASLIFLDVIFNHFNISNKSVIRVLKANTNAINYNKALGYVPLKMDILKSIEILILTKEDFNIKFQKLKKHLEVYFKAEYKLTVTGSVSDLNHDKINVFLRGLNYQGSTHH